MGHLLPFEINNENYCLLIHMQVLFVLYLVTFCIAQLVEGQGRNLWVARQNHAPVLLFIFLLEFYKCIFGANVIDLKIFETVVVIIIFNPVILKILQGVPYHLQQNISIFRNLSNSYLATGTKLVLGIDFLIRLALEKSACRKNPLLAPLYL